MSEPRERKWGGLVRKALTCAAVAGLAATVSAGAAFATDSTGEYYVDLPKADEVISFQHTGTDANGNTYNYEYVTIGSSETGRVAPMMQTWYETVGLNYINAYNGPGSIYAQPDDDSQTPDPALGYSEYTKGEAGSLQSNNSTLVIMGSANNEAPDEYIWNYCCWANGAEVAA
ncbi:MAG: hypothetical protein J5804_05035, partial [Eggerthellaceae bacterium]|nr:hypothetical protein [Eggerthellaceae bacterium]